MLVRSYDMPWRPAYEIYGMLAWFVGVVYFVFLAARGYLPPALGLSLAAFAFFMGARRGRDGLAILTTRASLSGQAMQMITTREHASLTRDPTRVFLGYGFAWEPVHSQRLHDLAKIDYKDCAVPSWVLPLLGLRGNPQPASEFGLPYIHGVEPREAQLYRPLENFEGGTLLVGSTQTGKGVMLCNLIAQAIRRQDVVVVIDPKNSRRLKKVVRRACRDFREPDTFMEFHPAFPDRGIRIDFTFNWQKPTEIASRIESIMPPDTGGAFTAFGWDAVNVVVQALVANEERPNLLKLMKYIERGIEPILQQSLQRFVVAKLGPTYRESAQFQKAERSAANDRRPTPHTSTELMSLVVWYEQHVPESAWDKVIDAQVRVFRHNREHYQKITSNLLPILSMLTTGDLGRTLSPDPFDADDQRPIVNFEKVEGGGHVLYLCLDSLPDPSVASAIGALALADLAARAGIRYNLGQRGRIALFVDEMANVINKPLIEILNKGAEGGIWSVCAMQTIGDLASRLGSLDAARMALGNLNNLIALRTPDRPTQEYVCETFGKTAVHSARVGINQGADTHFGDWSAGRSVQITETMDDRVPVDTLAKLPNLQFFAFAAARLYKGRVPMLDPEFDGPLRLDP